MIGGDTRTNFEKLEVCDRAVVLATVELVIKRVMSTVHVVAAHNKLNVVPSTLMTLMFICIATDQLTSDLHRVMKLVLIRKDGLVDVSDDELLEVLGDVENPQQLFQAYRQLVVSRVPVVNQNNIQTGEIIDTVMAYTESREHRR